MLSSKKEDEQEENVIAGASTLDKHLSVSYCSHLHVYPISLGNADGKIGISWTVHHK